LSKSPSTQEIQRFDQSIVRESSPITIMATCGDDLCNGLKYVLEQGVQSTQKNQNQQNDNNNYDNNDDPEMAMSRPFSTEEASTAAAMSVGSGGDGEKQETAPDAKSAAASLLSTFTGGAYQQQKAYSGAGDIQATVLMISGCKDAQTSADVSNVSSFTLPDPNGRAGGACTSALLQGMVQIFLAAVACLLLTGLAGWPASNVIRFHLLSIFYFIISHSDITNSPVRGSQGQHHHVDLCPGH
jgi:hypothetical protein